MLIGKATLFTNPLIEWVFYCLEESKMAQESRLV
ncbi:hypothetical protein J560_4455, partial [Acinetobacter baumannii 855125]